MRFRFKRERSRPQERAGSTLVLARLDVNSTIWELGIWPRRRILTKGWYCSLRYWETVRQYGCTDREPVGTTSAISCVGESVVRRYFQSCHQLCGPPGVLLSTIHPSTFSLSLWLSLLLLPVISTETLPPIRNDMVQGVSTSFNECYHFYGLFLLCLLQTLIEHSAAVVAPISIKEQFRDLHRLFGHCRVDHGWMNDPSNVDHLVYDLQWLVLVQYPPERSHTTQATVIWVCAVVQHVDYYRGVAAGSEGCGQSAVVGIVVLVIHYSRPMRMQDLKVSESGLLRAR